MTSFIGWVYRLADEHVDDVTDAVTEQSEAEKAIIQKFLNRHLRFNPDKHVRGHHKKEFIKKKDLENKECVELKNTGGVELKNTGGVLKWTKEALGRHVGNISESNVVSLSENTLETTVEKLSKESISHAVSTNPPSDAFFAWRRYIDCNFEELLHATCELYDMRPDMKFSIAFWDSFESKEAAEAARERWKDSMKISLLTIENNGHTLIGPWKTNQEAITYHNKNTELLKRMQDQVKYDHEIGKDIMNKAIKKKKKINVEQAGPDDPALASYIKSMNTIESLGAKPGLTKEERKELELAKRNKDDAETPDNAVGCDVFQAGPDGLKRTRLYTAADTPEDIEAQNKARADLIEGRTIPGKDGKLISLEELQSKAATLDAITKHQANNATDNIKN
jgi:hypothetical protein